MDVTVRPASEADLPAVLEVHTARTEFGSRWFTNPFAGGTEARYENLSPAQRWLHGGPWVDPQLLSLHARRFADAKGAVLIAERGGSVVGEADLWPEEEPLPAGAYLSVEALVARPADDADIERALLAAASHEARSRDLQALDIAPNHAGGAIPLLEPLGFVATHDLRTVHIDPSKRPKPPEHAVLNTAPSLSDLRGYVALDRRESPSIRIGNLGNEWAGGLLKEFSHPFGGLYRVDFSEIGVTGRVCTWFPEREAEVDLWLPPRALGNLPWFRAAVAAALDEVARHHRVSVIRTTVPSHLVATLKDIGFEDGGEPDLRLRKTISSSNL